MRRILQEMELSIKNDHEWMLTGHGNGSWVYTTTISSAEMQRNSRNRSRGRCVASLQELSRHQYLFRRQRELSHAWPQR